MRGLKSTLLLGVVLIGLVAYIFFVDQDRPVGEQDEKENVFATLPADEIEDLTIKPENGTASHLKKTDGKWTIVEPVQADADQGEVSSIASALSDIDVQRVVDENASDMKRYGLDPARLEIEFRGKDQKTSNRLLVGDKTPTGSEVYARTPDKPRVFLVSSFLDTTLNKDTLALRDKAILKFERDKVETLELTKGSTTQQFAKAGTEWKIVKPIAARGDFGAIEGVVERLGSAQMQGITAQEATDLKPYGLDKPTASATIGTGSARATLLLGKTENAVVYAKDASRPLIFTVAPTIETDVFKDLGDLRRKDLFDSRAFTVERIELRRGAETMTFEKTKDKDEKEIWKNAAGATVDEMKLQELLGRVTSLRADSFEASTHPSLKSPVLTVTVRYDQGKTETVTFGRAGMDVFAARGDEPGAAKLNAASFDEAIKALDALKS